LFPNEDELLNGLAWLLATSTDPAVRNPREAVEVAKRAVEATPRKQPIARSLG
jgi:hypothetical protein